MIRPAESPQRRAVDAARLRILKQVDRSGPMAVSELDRGRPMARHHARLLVLDLSRDALVSFVRSSAYGVRLVVITDAGRTALSQADPDDS